MRTIEQTGRFRRDYKSQAKGQLGQVLRAEFVAVVRALAEERPLDLRHRDHALTGEWKDHRDCHVRPDLVLIYRKIGTDVLQLVRIGSHAQLGL